MMEDFACAAFFEFPTAISSRLLLHPENSSKHEIANTTMDLDIFSLKTFIALGHKLFVLNQKTRETD